MYQLLIADDETIIRTGLERVVNWNELGFAVAGVVENGEEALDVIRSKPIDVILTDIQMPLRNGLSLAREARTIKPEIKVVIISGYSSFEYAQQGIALRVEGYILKPIDVRELSSVFRQLKERLDGERRIAAALSGTGLIEKKYTKAIIETIEQEKCAGLQEVIGGLAEELSPYAVEVMAEAYRRILRAVAAHFRFSQQDFVLPAGLRDAMVLAAWFEKEIADGISLVFAQTDQSVALLCHRAKEEIEKEYMKTSVSLRAIADRLHVSYGYLSGIFTKQWGISMKSYLIQVRMDKALELLLKRRYKIYEIALMVGYTNTRYFSDAFRNYYGVSPTQKLEAIHQMLPDQREES